MIIEQEVYALGPAYESEPSLTKVLDNSNVSTKFENGWNYVQHLFEYLI